ncbi:MAG: HEPN domain-containing protein, partial [Candidatus Aminicenantaceae bacterium]
FKWLEETEKNFASGALRSSLLSAYLAMFHSARSILYYDGYREKSHVCVARYLEANYIRKGHLEQKWVELLDHFREIRHSDQYSFNFFTSTEEAEDTIDKSKAFVIRMRNLLEEKSKT